MEGCEEQLAVLNIRYSRLIALCVLVAGFLRWHAGIRQQRNGNGIEGTVKEGRWHHVGRQWDGSDGRVRMLATRGYS